MARCRLMDKPEDYERIGVKPGIVELWEDGRRTFEPTGTFEWWYFDGVMDDGTKVVLSVHARSPMHTEHEGDYPFVHMNITMPDGRNFFKYYDCVNEKSSFKKGECDIQIGAHHISGNIKEYDIHIDPTDGCGFDLKLVSTSSAWRPETGYFGFGDNDETFFTWLCVVPRGEMFGTVTYEGVQYPVKGTGYHDHQWGNKSGAFLWNHWIWARQHMKDYSILLFDMVAQKQYGYERFPLMLIQDTKGNILFYNADKDNLEYETIKDYLQENTDKHCPAEMSYRVKNGGKTVEYRLGEREEIEVDDLYRHGADSLREAYDKMDLHPTYVRYLGHASMKMNDGIGTVTQEGELVYEMSYLAKDYRVFDK